MVSIILGGSENAFCEYEKAVCLLNNASFDVFLINDMIASFKHSAAHAVTMHPRKLRGWINQREYRGYPSIKQCWIDRFFPDLDARVALCWGGSSGLFAVKIAVRDLGYEKTILCGIPMDASAGHFLRHKPWSACTSYRPAWEAAKKMNRLINVRSMSGWTMDLLGFPTSQWLGN